MKSYPVTKEATIAFLECACRNWHFVPKLDDDEIQDLSIELGRLIAKAQTTAYKDASDALNAVIERSKNGELGTSKVIDMRKICEEALKDWGKLR